MPHTGGALRILLPWYALGDDGSLWHRGGDGESRLCVPNGTTRTTLIKFYHEVELSHLHLGADRTSAAMSRHFYWPNMLTSITATVGRCYVCASTKPKRVMSGYLQPCLHQTPH
jgi:hypothetical protein